MGLAFERLALLTFALFWQLRVQVSLRVIPCLFDSNPEWRFYLGLGGEVKCRQQGEH